MEKKCTLLSAWTRFCWEIEFLRWDISKKKERGVLQPDWTLEKNIFRLFESRWAAHGRWQGKNQGYFTQPLAYCHNVTKHSSGERQTKGFWNSVKDFDGVYQNLVILKIRLGKFFGWKYVCHLCKNKICLNGVYKELEESRLQRGEERDKFAYRI